MSILILPSGLYVIIQLVPPQRLFEHSAVVKLMETKRDFNGIVWILSCVRRILENFSDKSLQISTERLLLY
ncbi:hypothetical protein DOS48_06565 [Halorubrum sp. PV6]|nr:hypothetical protein DOS48_06565 [Halorubrum sp. PV6]